MVKLSYLKKMIDAYLEVKGDKELLSVATCHNSDDEFILHLADIYEGPIGSNPYTGRDQIALKKNLEVVKESEEQTREEGPIPNSAKDAYYFLEKKLRNDSKKSVMQKAAISWGALSTMQQAGIMDSATVEKLWSEFIIELMVRV